MVTSASAAPSGWGARTRPHSHSSFEGLQSGPIPGVTLCGEPFRVGKSTNLWSERPPGDYLIRGGARSSPRRVAASRVRLTLARLWKFRTNRLAGNFMETLSSLPEGASTTRVDQWQDSTCGGGARDVKAIVDEGHRQAWKMFGLARRGRAASMLLAAACVLCMLEFVAVALEVNPPPTSFT